MPSEAEAPYTPASYRSRVTLNVLNAVVAASGTEGGGECIVELKTALEGMCDAIAMLVAASGLDQTPKDRRDTADMCRKLVMVASNSIAAKLAAGEELPWSLTPIGELN